MKGVITDYFHFLPEVLPEAMKDALNLKNMQTSVELLLMRNPSHVTNPITNMEKEVVFDACNMFHLCRMVASMSANPEIITEKIRRALLEFVRRDSRFEYNGYNLLHTSMDISTASPWTSDPTPGLLQLSCIRFLVQELGADPNARTINSGARVLHLLVEKRASETRDSSARLLIELGAYLSMVDNAGRTAADLWMELNNQEFLRLPDWFQEDANINKTTAVRRPLRELNRDTPITGEGIT